jgi:hypothetical protein
MPRRENIDYNGDGRTDTEADLPGGPYDDNGDRRDDATGEVIPANQWAQAQQNSTQRRLIRDNARYAEGRRADGRERLDREAEQRREAGEYEREYAEYVSSGQRTRDLQAGREARPAPGTAGAPTTNIGDFRRGIDGAGGDGFDGGHGGGVEDWQRGLAGTPILGWLSGSDAAVDRALSQMAAMRARADWEGLDNWMPSANDLSVEYE